MRFCRGARCAPSLRYRSEPRVHLLANRALSSTVHAPLARARRYLPYNSHAASYTWKFLGNVLDMKLTLQENGVLDERENYAKLNLPDDFFVPMLHLYFNDDLTEA